MKGTKILLVTTILLLLASAGLVTSTPVDAKAAPTVSKLFVDKIHGETTLWVPAEYWLEMIVDRWGNLLCIAPSNNVNAHTCTELEFVEAIEDGQGNFLVKLRYRMVTGQGAGGIYPFRGLGHGMWFGLPCNGGYIKGFVYPSGNPFPFDHEENITSLPDGTTYVC